MAHPLEFIKPTSTFTAHEVIAIHLTALACQIAAVKPHSQNDEYRDLLEHWRNELFIIRGAVRNLEPPAEVAGQ